MLKVSIHAGPLSQASRFNRLARLDIGYERLAPIADYKLVLFTTGEGARPPATLRNYPRWSASLWDLAARAIVLCLPREGGAPDEELPPHEPAASRFAFASTVCAVIEHLPGDSELRRRTLATLEIVQHGRSRGTYLARLTEDAFGPSETAPFVFRPRRLLAAELVARAAAVRLAGSAYALPERPALALPDTVVEDGVELLPIGRLVEPARTGFVRWLAVHSEPPLFTEDAPSGLAPPAMYKQFLEEAL